VWPRVARAKRSADHGYQVVAWNAVFHCTVSVTVPEFCSEPAVPAIATV